MKRNSLKIIAVVFVLITLFSINAFAGDFTAKCVGVTDGDTIKVLTSDNVLMKIRLAEIDCPEKKQDFGQAAKQFTSNMVFGKDVVVSVTGKDQYQRDIAHISLPDGRSLNAELIKAGMAWHYKKYSKINYALYNQLENDAKANKVGLWSIPNPVAPWDFRREAKKK